MNSKKWSLLTIVCLCGSLVIIGITVVIIDPFFHYHAPFKNISYSLKNSEYMNDGISKHFKYNAMITGTSMAWGFDTAEVNELFDVDSIRVTYKGEGFKKINDNIKAAIAHNPELDFIIRGVDPIWFISNENWLGYEEYPDFLFDDDLWNDVYYLYNGDIFLNDVLPVIVRTMKGTPADTFEGSIEAASKANKQTDALMKYKRQPKEDKIIQQSETDEFFSMLDRNLEVNLISTIQDNPDITFYLFIPPYSICWWDSLNQNGTGVLLRRIEFEKYVIEKVLAYDNVRLFSFFNNFDLICNLENYTDEIHYVSDISSNMLIWMKNGDYEITKDNYQSYIREISEFYSNYNYDAVFAEKLQEN